MPSATTCSRNAPPLRLATAAIMRAPRMELRGRLSRPLRDLPRVGRQRPARRRPVQGRILLRARGKFAWWAASRLKMGRAVARAVAPHQTRATKCSCKQEPQQSHPRAATCTASGSRTSCMGVGDRTPRSSRAIACGRPSRPAAPAPRRAPWWPASVPCSLCAPPCACQTTGAGGSPRRRWGTAAWRH